MNTLLSLIFFLFFFPMLPSLPHSFPFFSFFPSSLHILIHGTLRPGTMLLKWIGQLILNAKNIIFSTPLIIRELQIKIIMKCHFTPVKMTSCYKKVKSIGKEVHWWWECTAILETGMEVPKNIKIKLPFDSAIPLLGIYAKEIKSLSQRHICTPKFIAAAFIVAKT